VTTSLTTTPGLGVDDVDLLVEDGPAAVRRLAPAIGRDVRLLVLDPPTGDPAGGVALATQCLDAARPALRDDGLVLTYTTPATATAIRRLLDETLGAGAFRAELVVPSRPAWPPQSPLSPIATEGQVLLLHAAEAGTVLRTPGKWDTLIIPGRPTSKTTPAAPPGPEDDEPRPVWTRDRILRAVRNYRRYQQEHSRTMSFDAYYERLVAAGGTPEFLRMQDGEILRYMPPGHRDVTPNVWFDLPRERPRTGHPEEREEGPVRRVLEWFAEPGDLVLDPMTGTGATLGAAAGMGHRAIGVELSPEWAAAARDRVRERTQG
jgi:DNA methylase